MFGNKEEEEEEERLAMMSRDELCTVQFADVCIM
jgi:hypothetical protein